MIACLATALLAPFFVEFTPDVRSTYVSLGKIMEDRPMQTTLLRAGYGTEKCGRFGFYNFDVSSLTHRRSQVHRRLLYHTEYGLFWDTDWKLAEDWKLRCGMLATVTLYRGFENRSSNGDYGWIQLQSSLENPYAVPYFRLRRYGLDTDYFYFRAGLRRKFRFFGGLYVTPEVYVDGGNGRNFKRVFGKKSAGGDWGSGGVASVTCRLETGWEFNHTFALFAFVEQYEVVDRDGRKANDASTNRCLHNDWTLGGIGLRMRF